MPHRLVSCRSKGFRQRQSAPGRYRSRHHRTGRGRRARTQAAATTTRCLEASGHGRNCHQRVAQRRQRLEQRERLGAARDRQRKGFAGDRARQGRGAVAAASGRSGHVRLDRPARQTPARLSRTTVFAPDTGPADDVAGTRVIAQEYRPYQGHRRDAAELLEAGRRAGIGRRCQSGRRRIAYDRRGAHS
jgi:hypothetical protein